MGICCSSTTSKLENKKTHPSTSGAGRISKDLNHRKQAKQEKNGEIEKYTELKAAMLIQKWFRVWMCQLQARREIAWRIFQKLEYYSERNQMRLNRFFRVLLDEFSSAHSKSKMFLCRDFDLKPCPSVFEDKDNLLIIPDDVEVNISPPFTVENLNLLMNFLKKGKILHYTCVINLLIMTTKEMETRPNFYEVSSSITQKITICGDLHGNLDDLLTIFYKNDIPSSNNPYVFNGDMVDRGPKSVEVMMILCYSFLLFPNYVCLNRGNHEDHFMNSKYGFLKEVTQKYAHCSTKIFNHFKGLFRKLPFGTIIDRKIFIVHGGISDITDLKILGEIERSIFSSIIKPPRLVSKNEKYEWEQVMDIFWSDPSSEDGCIENEFRGGGKCFGPDVTEEFLRVHDFQLLIRSHECKPEGYEYDHSGKVLTVFSSSNYYHPGSNKGAYIVYTGDLKQLRHIQFLSNDESLKNINFKDKVFSMEEKAINDLKRMIFTNHVQLLKRFKEHDENNLEKITMEDYGKVLQEVLGMNLPWRLLQPKIAKKDNDNLVLYQSIFEFAQSIQDESASEILQCNLEMLKTIFRAIDRDNSGFITMTEFNDAMSILKKHSDLDMHEDDINDLGELIDFDKDGFIDINEFFEAFKFSRD